MRKFIRYFKRKYNSFINAKMKSEKSDMQQKKLSQQSHGTVKTIHVEAGNPICTVTSESFLQYFLFVLFLFFEVEVTLRSVIVISIVFRHYKW